MDELKKALEQAKADGLTCEDAFTAVIAVYGNPMQTALGDDTGDGTDVPIGGTGIEP